MQTAMLMIYDPAPTYIMSLPNCRDTTAAPIVIVLAATEKLVRLHHQLAPTKQIGNLPNPSAARAEFPKPTLCSTLMAGLVTPTKPSSKLPSLYLPTRGTGLFSLEAARSHRRPSEPGTQIDGPARPSRRPDGPMVD